MNLHQAIQHVCERVDYAMSKCGRTDTVAIEAAVKTQSPHTCRQVVQSLIQANLPAVLGHNRVQEATQTASDIRLVPGAQIHLIGPLQKNKINQALACIDLIETIDSAELVDHIDKRAHRILPVYIQVNVSDEPSKLGCVPDDVHSLVEKIELSTSLTVEGFMTVGLNSTDELAVRKGYQQLRDIRDECARQIDVPESELALSMGMSRDFEWAILEGATLIRIGTAFFGPRPQTR